MDTPHRTSTSVLQIPVKKHRTENVANLQKKIKMMIKICNTGREKRRPENAEPGEYGLESRALISTIYRWTHHRSFTFDSRPVRLTASKCM